MKVKDGQTREIHVERDRALSRIEVQLGDPAGEGRRVLRLSREEARRLAALLLFEAGRLDRHGPGSAWRMSGESPIGMSIRAGDVRLLSGNGGAR